MRLFKVIFILLLFFVFGCGQSDREAYEKAKLKDTIEGYQEFIKKYPKSEFRVSAGAYLGTDQFASSQKKFFTRRRGEHGEEM